MQVLLGIASACCHLHYSIKLLHGDLYAHNILVSRTGMPLLTDFGAASFVPTNILENTQIEKLEKIEVRAFSCLIEDLLSRLHEETVGLKVLSHLQTHNDQPAPDIIPRESEVEVQRCLYVLMENCRVDEVLCRPQFAEILNRLHLICRTVLGENSF